MNKGLMSATLAIAVLLIFSVAAADATEQYRTEISAFYSNTDGSPTSKTALIFGHPATKATTRLVGVSEEVFFAPVNTEEHSYAEAAFLERTGSAFISAASEKTTVREARGDSPLESLGINLSQPDFPLVAQLMYTKSLVDFNTPDDLSIKSDVYDVKVGNYFAKTLLAGLEYSYGSAEPSSYIFPFNTARSRDYAIFAKYVHELADYQELSLEATAGKSTIGNNWISRNTTVSFTVDYFFNKSLSIGVGFENSSGTAVLTEGKTYSANVRYFISPHFSIQAIYDTFQNSNPDFENEDTYDLILAGRF